MKKFGKYLLITLLLLLGLCCIGVLYLFFVPGSSLFGISYISLNEMRFSKVYEDAQIATCHTIKLVSRDYEVEVVPTDNINTVSVQVFANSFGFVPTKNSNVVISSEIKNSILTFSVSEPSGMATNNRSKIQLYLPSNLNKSLHLVNNNAQTTISGSILEVNNLIYSTNAGRFVLSNANISGDLTLDIGRAVFSFGQKLELNKPNVNLSMHNGKFDGADYDFNNIDIVSNNYGSVVAKSCNKLTSNHSQSGGRVDIDSVEDINLVGGDTNVYITSLNKCTKLELKNSGRVEIGETKDVCIITTNFGNIKINQAKDSVYLKTANGNINVAAAHKLVQADTEYGDISITFASEAGHYADGESARSLISKNTNGTIVAYGVEHVNIEMSGRGRAEIYMDNVKSENTIKVGQGSAYVEIKEIDKTSHPEGNAKYTLKNCRSNGVIDVNIDNVVYSSAYEIPDVEINPQNPLEEDNTLTVYSESHGTIKLRNTFSRGY